MDVLVKIVETALTFFILFSCDFLSQVLLTSFLYEMSSLEEDGKKLILNILYSHIAVNWLIDTVLNSINIVVQIMFNISDDWYLKMVDQYLYFDYLLAVVYFVVISVFRVIRHYNVNLYLDIRKDI